MNFGQLIFWIIIAIIAYYAYTSWNINILIIAIAILVLYYLVGLFTAPHPPAQIIVTPPAAAGAQRLYEGFAPLDQNADQQHAHMHPYAHNVDSNGKFFDIDERAGTKMVLNTCGN